MTTIAGIDVGNSTTEVVLVADDGRVLAADRSPTRGEKGSPASLRGAANLLTRLERRAGLSAELVAAAPQRPVRTRAVGVTPAGADTGRLDVLPRSGDTPGGAGLGLGAPRWADGPYDDSGPVVLLVRAGAGFRSAADDVRRWQDKGADVRAVLLADDEAVLVAARTDGDLPVVDLVDVDRVARGERVVVEVRPAGHALLDLGDPIRLGALLEAEDVARAELAAAVAAVGDASRGVVVLLPDADRAPRRVPPPVPVADDAEDRWPVELREVATSVGAPVDAATSRDVVVATLRSAERLTDPGPLLGDLLGPRVVVIDGETRAAWTGATRTPGVRADAVVVDLGGGSVDAILREGTDVVLAGAGELLTLGVARLLDLPLGAADHVKRGPCSRVESPQVLLAEDGTRVFLDRPTDSSTVGQLVVEGPVGLLAFGQSTAPAQWRALRRRLKERVVADNVVRALDRLAAPGLSAQGDLLLVGGAAGDEELLGLLRGVVPERAVGRARIPGLGHRHAVAYGLALLASEAFS